MSGIGVLRTLFLAHGPLVAVVPDARIIGEALPAGTQLPALSLEIISSVDRRPLKIGGTRRVTDRVQVTVHTNDASQRNQIMGLVRLAAAGAIGDFGTATAASVQTDGQGPDTTDPETRIRTRSQDFLVSYNEPA